MARWADPFYIFGTAMQIVLAVWVIIMLYRGVRYLRDRKKYHISGETKAWYKAVMAQDGPNRITPEHVESVRRQMLSDDGKKIRVSGRKRKVIAAGIIVAVMFGMYSAGLFNEFLAPDPPMPPTVALVNIISQEYFTNLSACQSGLTVTRVQGTTATAFGYFYADERLNLTLYVWYEFTLVPSSLCTGNDFYHVVEARKVGA